MNLTAEEIEARLLYRDGLMLVIDKPAGLPVHPGPKGGPNLEQYFQYLCFGFPKPPSLAHRLDRDTSGCLILGRHAKALRRLGKLFESGRIEKTYWAVVHGCPGTPEGVIDQPLAKLNRKQGWKMMIDAKEGQVAVTHYRVLANVGGLSFMEFRPKTGRTHQIRVHSAFLGCPLLGDPVYGPEPEPGVAMQLHARAVVIPLYPAKEAIRVEAKPPAHMQAILGGFSLD